MSENHTPGPWQHELTDGYMPSAGHPEHGIDDSLILAGAEEHFRPIAHVNRVYNGSRDVEMERANARLLAAAPVLLAALEHLYRLHCEDVFRLPDEHYIAICNAASAIAEAEGRA